MTILPPPPSDRDTEAPSSLPSTIPPVKTVWPEEVPPWMRDVVMEFTLACDKAFDRRLGPVYELLDELKVSRREQDSEIRALKAQVRKLRKRVDVLEAGRQQ